MGMAAGQARLLSITSRISDNELRAQIVNNNKMRLATKSSQVSEAYVTALNDAQMMFTSYDANNNASYQKLTFNAMTAYNPYNNQYVLTNASGNVLLAERDAINYKNANGDVDKFLEAYNLKKDTSYFKNLVNQYDSKNKGIPFKTGEYNLDGKEELGYISATDDKDTVVTPEALTEYIKKLYEGDDKHAGYMNIVSSDYYYNYQMKLSDYITKKDAYYATIAKRMSDKLEGLFNTTDKDYKLADIITGLDKSDLNRNQLIGEKGFADHVLKIVDQAKGFSKGDTLSNTYFTDLTNRLNELKRGTRTQEIKLGKDTETDLEYKLERDSANANTLQLKAKQEDGTDRVIATFTRAVDSSTNPSTTNYSGQYVIGKNEDGSNNIVALEYVNNAWKIKDSSKAAENGNLSINFDVNFFNVNPATGSKVTMTSDISKDEIVSELKNIIDSLRNSIYTVWDAKKIINPELNNDKDEYKQYKIAAEVLAAEIFGSVGSSASKTNLYAGDPDLLENIGDCLKEINDPKYFNPNASTDNNYPNDKKDNLNAIYEAWLLDCIMDTYGEPNYAWVDTNNPNENAAVKAQWYQNLFERIQKSGFKTLQDGLASSNEWIQFAFESGIVNMEQVDANKNWKPLIYTNCSNITEETKDAAIAKAEAEYKAAMNKIENKDKRYDLELKNIDTEHNSLQTEYESIKTAIGKNIDRTFKLYG